MTDAILKKQYKDYQQCCKFVNKLVCMFIIMSSLAGGSLYGYEYGALASAKPGKNMEPYNIEPSFGEDAIFQHGGEEFMYLLEGKHLFIYDGKKYLIEEGDYVYFDSSVPHTGRSLGKKKAKVLAVIFSYKRL